MEVFFLSYKEKAPLQKKNKNANVYSDEEKVTKRPKLIRKSDLMSSKLSQVGLEFKLFVSKICSLSLQNLMIESFDRIDSCYLYYWAAYNNT